MRIGDSIDKDSSADRQALVVELRHLEMTIPTSITLHIYVNVDRCVVLCTVMIRDVVNTRAPGLLAQESEYDNNTNIGDRTTTRVI